MNQDSGSTEVFRDLASFCTQALSRGRKHAETPDWKTWVMRKVELLKFTGILWGIACSPSSLKLKNESDLCSHSCCLVELRMLNTELNFQLCDRNIQQDFFFLFLIFCNKKNHSYVRRGWWISWASPVSLSLPFKWIDFQEMEPYQLEVCESFRFFLHSLKSQSLKEEDALEKRRRRK